ncbi:hypothetical protein GCM10009850_094190 [Nonomuraea monospora]|uniref:Uncharacterized protein n=1 Tax=Nonomuraea monospora TaxID=568818 RepID=A0ABP5PQM6_9ACTN
MSKVMLSDYAWVRDWAEEIFTVTFVRGLDERETLRRFGVVDQNIHPVDDDEVVECMEATEGCGDLVLVTRAGDWTIAFEHGGWEGTRAETLRELTRDGGEPVSVMRHDYAAAHDFEHAVDGRIRTAFRPQLPHERWGTHPDALNEDLRELGLEPEPDEELQYLPGTVPAALTLASRISGVLFTPALLDMPLLGGVITDAAPADPQEGDPLARSVLRVFHPELAQAIDDAPPVLQRRAALAEARRQCEVAGVASHPVLTAALAEAERGGVERGEADQGESKRGQAERGGNERGEGERGQAEQGQAERGEAERGKVERGEIERGEAGRAEVERGGVERGEAGRSEASPAGCDSPGARPIRDDDSPLAALIRDYESELTGHPIDAATGEWMTGPPADPRLFPVGGPDPGAPASGGQGGVRGRNIFSTENATGMPACPSCKWHHRPDKAEREAVRPRWQAAISVRHALLPDPRRAAYNTHTTLIYGAEVLTAPERAADVAAMLRAGPGLTEALVWHRTDGPV